MRFVEGGPQIPIELVKQQERGEVLFVCGAGVSLGAGLPNFGGLTEGVYEFLGESWEHQPAERAIMDRDGALYGQYDRAFRALERRLIGSAYAQAQTWRTKIRDAIRARLTPKLGAELTDHLCLLKLSRDGNNRTRLLTTNFDTLFERAWASTSTPDLASHACQSMPRPKAAGFEGVLHLHGRLRDDELNLADTDLVLTSAEFGEAYLRSGWASRYVYDLARTHHIVLVGYSADDPPMRYLLEALEADRELFPDLKTIHAFASAKEGEDALQQALWQAKGIEPIIYMLDGGHSHSALYATIRAWSDYAADPTAWRFRRLKALLDRPPTGTTEETLCGITELLRHGDSGVLLGQISPDARWLPILRSRGVFGSGDRGSGPWIVERMSDVEMVRTCATEPLDSNACTDIEWALARKDVKIHEEIKKAWRWILEEKRKTSNRHPLWYVNSNAAKEDEHGFRLAVIEHFSPTIRVTRPFRLLALEKPESEPMVLRSIVSIDFECSSSVNIDSVLAALPMDADVEYRMLRALCRALDQALDTAMDAGFIGTIDRASHSVPSVARHDQNIHRTHFVPIVRLIAELWARFASRQREHAVTIAHTWPRSQFALFQRLFLHALSIPGVFGASEAAKYLLNLDPVLFWSANLRRETMRLMAERWDHFSEPERDELTDRIVAGPPRTLYSDEVVNNAEEWTAILDRSVLVRLVRIRSSERNLNSVGIGKIHQITRDHPDWVLNEGDRDDFGSWTTTSWGLRGNPSLVTATEPQKLVATVVQLQDERPFINGDLWRAYCAADPEKALDGLLADPQAPNWAPKLLMEFLWAATDAPTAQLLPRVVELIKLFPDPTLDAVLQASSSWLQKSRIQLNSVPGVISEAFLSLWDRLASRTYLRLPEVTEADFNSEGVLDAALNEPGGQLAWTLFDAAVELSSKKGEGFPEEIRHRLTMITKASGRNGLLGRAYLVQFLPWIFHVDPEWASAQLVPLLASEDREAALLWQARLFRPDPMVGALFNSLKRRLLDMFRDPRVAPYSANGLVAAVLLPLLWKAQNPALELNLSSADVRAALGSAPAEVRRFAAWQFGAWMREKDGEPVDAGERWKRLFGPLFKACWPQDALSRDAQISADLVRFAASAGDAFEDAVGAIAPVLVPFDIFTIRLNILDVVGSGSVSLPARYPVAFVHLLSTIVDPDKAQVPGDLGEVLADCLHADASLEANRDYQKLRGILRRQSA